MLSSDFYFLCGTEELRELCLAWGLPPESKGLDAVPMPAEALISNSAYTGKSQQEVCTALF